MSTIDLEKKVKVWNRAVGGISYNIPELRIKREWRKTGDLQIVKLEELDAFRYVPGGAKLMNKYMLIKDQDVCEFLGMPTDPEYFYNENDIKVLLEKGTTDQLLDCLEFAPKGVLDILKKVAVETKLDSSEKRKIIGEHLNVNIDAMIRNNEASKIEGETVNEEAPKGRRSAPVKSEESKVEEAPKKYNVVNRS